LLHKQPHRLAQIFKILVVTLLALFSPHAPTRTLLTAVGGSWRSPIKYISSLSDYFKNSGKLILPLCPIFSFSFCPLLASLALLTLLEKMWIGNG